ncbi:Hypothetical protein BHY_1215 (plasmid) [Borrelia nietonii YOR]|uniref:Uncharacterized protein n=2 Tax=Borrelia TaxID=138 RepID=W5SG98_9SPIR|nr:MULTISPECIES: hypothetical protein [Borrelia]AHH04166.1 Hypothetical protein BHY_1215 [Borrelia nietonii YOR]AHH14441.1 Hypothetical protein BHW_0117600 [Borrelia hermsii MTW]UPA10023.1 hypothetical protein bhYOR_001368 [Borrelia nietonii YOR]
MDKYCQLELQKDVKKTQKFHDEILKCREDIANADFVKSCRLNEQLDLKMSEVDELEKTLQVKRCLDGVKKYCLNLSLFLILIDIKNK